MSKLIIVRGVSNSGKSSSIRKFVEIHGIYLPKGEISIVFTINVNGKALRIGVISAGDDCSVLKRGFDFLEEFNCDIIVCATKSGGASVHCLDDIIARNKFTYVEVKTTQVSDASEMMQQNALIAAEIDARILRG